MSDLHPPEDGQEENQERSRRGRRPWLAAAAVLVPVLVLVAVNTARDGLRRPRPPGAAGGPRFRPGPGSCALLSEADVTAAAGNQPSSLRPSDGGLLPRCEWIVGGKVTEQIAVQFLDPAAPTSTGTATEVVSGPWSSGAWDEGSHMLVVREAGLEFSVQASGALVAKGKQLSTELAIKIVERS